VTVLFCDVTGSTAIGEALDAESLRLMMSRYFERAREIIERHGGTVEKFIGDAVMAVFGVPRIHEDDALRAVRAAVDLREALPGLNDEVARRLGVAIAIRTGINTGEVVAGSEADGQALVTGEAVNAAKRLEEAAAPGEILIGELTEHLLREAALLEPLDPLPVKGKSKPLHAFRVLQVRRAPAPFTPRLDSLLIGRERELDQLREAFEKAARGRTCELVTVLGAAGIGKSRLALELAAAIGDDATFLVGHCVPYGKGITFAPLAEMVRQLGEGEIEATLRRELADEEDAAPAVERLTAAIAREGAAASTQETFWATRRLFQAIARSRPLVLLFEDVHWAEPTLLDLVEYLADLTRGVPVLLLCLARTELLLERPLWAGNRSNARTIELEPLGREEVDALIVGLSGASPPVEDAWARIAAAAEGNPLFVEQMLALESDLPGSGEDVRVPPTIHALLAARLDRLGADERAVIEAAAVIGAVFSWDAVGELVAPDQHHAVGLHLMELVRKQLIRLRHVSFAGSDTFRFRHNLIREAAYHAVAKQTRADLHERYARWLERAMGNRITEYEETLGFHLEQACRYRSELAASDEHTRRLAHRAAELLTSAGRRAFGSGDMPAAVKLFTRAMLLPHEEEPALLELVPDLAVALMETGELTRANALLDRTIEAAGGTEHRGLQAHAALVRALVHQKTEEAGKFEEVRDAAQRAIATFAELGDERGLARAWRLLSLSNFLRWELVAGTEALSRALHHAERGGDRRERATALDWLGRALYYGPTPVAEAIRRCEQIRDTAGDRIVEATTVALLGGLLAMQERFSEARELLARSTSQLQELGVTFGRGHGRSFAADVELLAADPKAAEEELRSGLETLERIGDRAGAVNIAYELAEALYAQGRYEEAQGQVDVGADALNELDVFTRVEGMAIRAKLLARAERFVEAEMLAREAVELGDSTDGLNMRAQAWAALAEVLGLAGRSVEARSAVDQAVGLFEQKGNIAAAAGARRLLDAAVTPA